MESCERKFAVEMCDMSNKSLNTYLGLCDIVILLRGWVQIPAFPSLNERIFLNSLAYKSNANALLIENTQLMTLLQIHCLSYFDVG